MIIYSYGILPSKDEFDRCFERECPDGFFQVRNCKLVGNHEFTCDELYVACEEQLALWEQCDSAENPHGDWVSSVLFVLGIEWI